jgi:hypothetical protein
VIFWRIVDNQLHPVKEIEYLGFEKSEGLRIPDNYLDKQEFMVMRTCHGIGDWGIISAMPRLLKEKYLNCKVYVPTKKLLKKLYGQDHNNVHVIFDNNPYVDEFVDEIDGEIFHDHYRIYEKDNPNVPLIEQILKFWQFELTEYWYNEPELYWSDNEVELGDSIIQEYVGNKEFGCLLISDRFGQNGDKVFDDDVYKKEVYKIKQFLEHHQLPYFYWVHEPLSETSFNFIDKLLDLRHIDLRVQLYIRSKAKLNIGNQCGLTQTISRYSKCYTSQRQYPIGSNIIKGEIYL